MKPFKRLALVVATGLCLYAVGGVNAFADTTTADASIAATDSAGTTTKPVRTNGSNGCGSKPGSPPAGSQRINPNGTQL